MAASTLWYGKGAQNVIENDVDWEADTIKGMLVTASYTPDVDAHDFLNDVSSNECSGTGYSAGGVTLASKALVFTGGSNLIALDAADITISGLDLTTAARYMVFYKSRGGASSADELIGYLDFGADVDPGGNDLVITWPSDGVLKATY